LEDEELHHSDWVDVGASSLWVSVVIHGSNDESEGIPSDEFIRLCELVAVLTDVLVGLFEHVGPEGGHVCLWGMVIYKFNRGGVEIIKTRG